MDSSKTAAGTPSALPPRRGAAPGRTYGGRSAEDRRLERRSQFISAAITVIGDHGYQAASVRALCREAGLAERYYYESFSDREQVLVAVYDEVMTDLVVRCFAAVPTDLDDVGLETRLALDAFIRTVTADRRRARIQLIEVVGVSDDLERRRREVMHSFADLIANRARELDLGDGIDVVIACRALVGAVNELLVDWYCATVPIDIGGLVDTCTEMFLRVLAPGRRRSGR